VPGVSTELTTASVAGFSFFSEFCEQDVIKNNAITDKKMLIFIL
jgi:hypothetical protein